MPVSSNVTVTGTNEFAAGFGDYVSGGANGHWQSFSSIPYILEGLSVACDFSQNGSYLVELISATQTTIMLANLPVGQPVRIVTIQPTSGTPGTVAWAGPTLRWCGGTVGAPTSTLAAGDVFIFYSPEAGITFAGAAMINC